jgi:hypothetical protein
MALRTAHGKGRDAVVRVEVLPADELPAVTPAVTDRSGRDAAGRFARYNTVSKKPRLRPGVLAPDADAGPAFEPYARWAKSYYHRRRRELAQAHGGSVSAGVANLIASAAQQLAQSRFLAARAAEDGDADRMKLSSSLADAARQNELAGFEIAAREAKARPNPDPFGHFKWKDGE